jgi:hypothetical protein
MPVHGVTSYPIEIIPRDLMDVTAIQRATRAEVPLYLVTRSQGRGLTKDQISRLPRAR